MDNRYEAYLTVTETGSFSKAARRLYLTQPTISRQISSLEAEFGMRLLDRSATHVYPTQAGRIAEDYLRQIRELENRLRKELSSMKTEGRELTLLCPDNMVTYDYKVFWRIIGCASQSLGVKIRVEPTPTARETAEALRSRRADAALGLIEPYADDPSLVCRQLLEGTVYVLCSVSHPLANLTELASWRDFEGWTVLLPSDDLQNTQEFLDQARMSAGRLVHTERVSSTPAMVPLILRGGTLGFSAFPLHDIPDLRCIPLKLYPARHLGLTWLAERQDFPFARLADEVEHIYRETYTDGKPH